MYEVIHVTYLNLQINAIADNCLNIISSFWTQRTEDDSVVCVQMEKIAEGSQAGLNIYRISLQAWYLRGLAAWLFRTVQSGSYYISSSHSGLIRCLTITELAHRTIDMECVSLGLRMLAF